MTLKLIWIWLWKFPLFPLLFLSLATTSTSNFKSSDSELIVAVYQGKFEIGLASIDLTTCQCVLTQARKSGILLQFYNDFYNDFYYNYLMILFFFIFLVSRFLVIDNFALQIIRIKSNVKKDFKKLKISYRLVKV